MPPITAAARIFSSGNSHAPCPTTMATMAMGNSIKAWAKGKKAKVGKAKVACKLELGYSCRATARACKK